MIRIFIGFGERETVAWLALTPGHFNATTELQAPQFKCLGEDALIGPLPPVWNHFVGYSEAMPEAANVLYTLEGPSFEQVSRCERGDAWFADRERMLRVDQHT